MRKQVWTYGTHQCSSNNTKIKQHFYKFDDDMIIELMNSAGLSQIPYEEYINIDVDAEFGCLTLKN